MNGRRHGDDAGLMAQVIVNGGQTGDGEKALHDGGEVVSVANECGDDFGNGWGTVDVVGYR